MQFELKLAKFRDLIDRADAYNLKTTPDHMEYARYFKIVYPCSEYPDGAVFFNDNAQSDTQIIVELIWREAMGPTIHACTMNGV